MDDPVKPEDPSPSLSESPTAVPELSRLMISLLKGVIYREDDERLWASLLRLRNQVRAQAEVLLLDLVVDEAEGFAFLKGRPDPDPATGAPPLPRLIPRRPLSYPVSLLLVVLRKRLLEFDAQEGDGRLVLTRDELVELMRIFLPAETNETRLVKQIEGIINKVVELGFLRRLKSSAAQPPGSERFEVRRILRAYIDAQWLAELDERLAAYRAALCANAGKGEGED